MSLGLSATSVVSPIRISAPGTTDSADMRTPSRYIPFLLSRSESSHPPLPCASTAWVLEMLLLGCHSRSQQSLDAPIVETTCLGGSG